MNDRIKEQGEFMGSLVTKKMQGVLERMNTTAAQT
jgi:hypothetical protein